MPDVRLIDGSKATAAAASAPAARLDANDDAAESIVRPERQQWQWRGREHDILTVPRQAGQQAEMGGPGKGGLYISGGQAAARGEHSIERVKCLHIRAGQSAETL